MDGGNVVKLAIHRFILFVGWQLDFSFQPIEKYFGLSSQEYGRHFDITVMKIFTVTKFYL